MAPVELVNERQNMKKLVVIGIFASALAFAAPARAGVGVSVNIGVPILAVQVGLTGVYVQAGPVAVGVGCARPVVCAEAPVVSAAPPVSAKPAPARASRRVVSPPPLTVYQGPYPSHIAPPFSP
jgi:hypothetical protein